MSRALYAPRWLDEAGRSAWRHAVAVLQELGDDAALSAGALERYASAPRPAAALRAEWQAGYGSSPRSSIAISSSSGGRLPASIMAAIDASSSSLRSRVSTPSRCSPSSV